MFIPADAGDIIITGDKMIAAINDISLGRIMPDKEVAIQRIRDWMEICKKLESKGTSAVERLYSVPFDKTIEVAPGYKLIQLVKEFKDMDDRRYLIHLLTNLDRPRAEDLPKEPFCFEGKESKICAWAKDGVVISIVTDCIFSNDTLAGKQAGKVIVIKNIAKQQHIDTYKELLGIRLFEANPKHRKKAYYSAGGRYVDAMDLSDGEAQELLDRAIEIDGKLYGRMNGKYYCFQRHHDNYYHAYQNEKLDLHIRKQIDQLSNKL